MVYASEVLFFGTIAHLLILLSMFIVLVLALFIFLVLVLDHLLVIYFDLILVLASFHVSSQQTFFTKSFLIIYLN